MRVRGARYGVRGTRDEVRGTRYGVWGKSKGKREILEVNR